MSEMADYLTPRLSLRRPEIGLSGHWGGLGSMSSMWRIADGGGVEQLDGSFLHQRTHTTDPEETYPDYLAPLIRRGQAGEREALLGTFGLAPKSKLPPGKHYATMNARSETVGEKPTYRTVWSKLQLCLIPCAAIYEPNYETGQQSGT